MPPLPQSSSIPVWKIQNKRIKDSILTQEELKVLGEKERKEKGHGVKWPYKDMQQAREKQGEADPPLSHVRVIFAAYSS